LKDLDTARKVLPPDKLSSEPWEPDPGRVPEIAANYGFHDPARLVNHLFALYNYLNSQTSIERMKDAGLLEGCRVRIHRALIELDRALMDGREVSFHAKKPLKKAGIDFIEWRLQLAGICKLFEDNFCERATPARKGRPRTPAYLVEAIQRLGVFFWFETGKKASVYPDDGRRKGNEGANFIRDCLHLVLGRSVPLSRIEVALQAPEYRKFVSGEDKFWRLPTPKDGASEAP
jgi:hypothetical protein